MQTTTEAAATLGLARRTIQKWCARLGYQRTGRDYLLTDEQVREIAQAAYDKPGRPRKEKE